VVVALSEAIHDPDAMVILLRNADVTYSAVFRPGRLHVLAGATSQAGIIQDMVVWVLAHEMDVGAGSDHGSRGSDTLVGEDVGRDDCQAYHEVVEGSCTWPG